MKHYFFVVIENLNGRNFTHNMEKEAENKKDLFDWIYKKFGENVETIMILNEEA